MVENQKTEIKKEKNESVYQIQCWKVVDLCFLELTQTSYHPNYVFNLLNLKPSMNYRAPIPVLDNLNPQVDLQHLNNSSLTC